MITADFPRVLNVLFIQKVNFEKDPLLPIEKFPSLVLFRNAMWLQHIIQLITLYHLSSGRLREVTTKEKMKP